MLKEIKRLKELPCVKQHGTRHLIAHLIGTNKHSICNISVGYWMSKGFEDGVKKGAKAIEINIP